MSKVRPSEIQDPMNTTGFNTTKNISHGFRLESTNHQHPPRSTLYDAKPLELVLGSPGPVHDQFVTTNCLYHGPKRHEDIYLQANHPKAPGAQLTHINPNFNLKIARGGFSLKPNHFLSENHDAFKARRPFNDIYGPPTIHNPPRDVFVPQYQNDIYPFDKDLRLSVLRYAHPYLSVTQFDYRKFKPEELAFYEMCDQIERSEKKTDVAIKLRTRPMLDPFEHKVYKVGGQDTTNRLNEAPAPRDYTNRKLHFKVPPYYGCPPRTFAPVEHVGQTTTFMDSFSCPYSGNYKENFTHPLKVCYLQPTISAAGAYEIPNMYRTENETYGCGRSVSTFHDIYKRNLPTFDTVYHE